MEHVSKYLINGTCSPGGDRSLLKSSQSPKPLPRKRFSHRVKSLQTCSILGIIRNTKEHVPNYQNLSSALETCSILPQKTIRIPYLTCSILPWCSPRMEHVSEYLMPTKWNTLTGGAVWVRDRRGDRSHPAYRGPSPGPSPGPSMAGSSDAISQESL